MAPASNNGGRYNTVHRQTDDGLVFSVAMGEALVPIVFTFRDYLGDVTHGILAAGFYPHKKLMRNDCGWRVKDDSAEYRFSWQDKRHVTDGFTDTPSGEFSEAWHEEPNCAEGVALEGIRGHRQTWWRQDREYWTPGTTLQADAPEDLFGPKNIKQHNPVCDDCGAYRNPPKEYDIPTFLQRNPKACPPKRPNHCDLVEYGA